MTSRREDGGAVARSRHVPLNCFHCQFEKNYSHMRKVNMGWEIASTRYSCGHDCGAYSWLLVDEGGPSLVWVIPALAEGPYFIDKLWLEVWGKTFLPKLLLVTEFITETKGKLIH